MRCPDCAKFVSFDEPQVEIEQEDLTREEEGFTVNVSIRMVLPCADCGTELKDYTEDLDIDIEHSCEGTEEEEDTLLIDEPSTSDDYRPAHDKKGKPIPQRFQKHFYIAEISGSVICGKCGEEIPFSENVEVQSSSFDECC